MEYRETLTYFWFTLDTEEKTRKFNEALSQGELTGNELIALYSALDIPIAEILKYVAPTLKVHVSTRTVVTYNAFMVDIISEDQG